MNKFDLLEMQKNLLEYNERLKKMKNASVEEILTMFNEQAIPLTEEMILNQYDQYISVSFVDDYFYDKYNEEFRALDNKKNDLNTDYLLEVILKLVKKKRRNLLNQDPWFIMNLIEKISESEPLRNQLKKLLSYMEKLTEAGKRINRKDFERQYNLNVLSILVEILMLLRSQRLSLTELKEVDRILNDYIQWFDLSEEDKMNSQMELLSCLATHGYSSVVQTKKEELIKQYPNHELQILGSIFNGLKICRKDIERLRKEAKQIKPKNETEFMILKEIVNYR